MFHWIMRQNESFDILRAVMSIQVSVTLVAKFVSFVIDGKKFKQFNRGYEMLTPNVKIPIHY